MTDQRQATVSSNSQPYRKKGLTKGQEAANEKLGGMNALFYVNQLVTLIENDLIDPENEDLENGLEKLHGLLGSFAKRKAA